MARNNTPKDTDAKEEATSEATAEVEKAESYHTRRKEREAAPPPDDSWVPASALPEIDADNDYTYRWIRVSHHGNQDNTNINRRLREGWEPVTSKEVEELGLRLRGDLNPVFTDGVEIGGLLLCKMPTAKVMSRRRYYERLNGEQVDAVDNDYMRENDPRMAKFRERVSRFGNGGL